MDEEEFEKRFGPLVQLEHLNGLIMNQLPAGMHEKGIVMDVGETVNIIQVWLLQQFAEFAEATLRDAQYLQATASAVSVATLQIKAVKESIV